MDQARSRFLSLVRSIGLLCLIVSFPNIIGEVVPIFENNVTDAERSVKEERVKLKIPDQVSIVIRTENKLKADILRALTSWKKSDSDSITITFYGKVTPSIIRHEVYHTYRVSKLKNLDPNGGFFMKRREEFLANIYALTGAQLR